MKIKKNTGMRNAILCIIIAVITVLCTVSCVAHFSAHETAESQPSQSTSTNSVVIEQHTNQPSINIESSVPNATVPGDESISDSNVDIDNEIVSCAHTFMTRTLSKEPTCNEDGVAVLTCHCGATKSETIPATDHEYRLTEAYEASCTHPGYMIYECLCGDKKTETVPQLWHDHVAGERKEATCTTEGYIMYVCKCGDTKKETLPVIPHTFKKVSTSEPTCAQEGKITYRCACGAESYEAIAKVAHKYAETSRVDSTTTVHGNCVYTCKICKYSYTEQLPLKPAAMYTDMCGDSLINKPLPHDEHRELVQKIFDNLNSQYNTREIALEHRIILNNYDEGFVREWLKKHYTYAVTLYTCTIYKYDYKPSEFIMWGSDEIWSEMESIQEEVQRILKELGIDKNMTQYEAIQRINNYVCESMYYEYDASCRKYTILHSMFGESGVCYNYAMKFQLLCLGAGIECEYYASNTMNHAWNKVIFSDGTSYWVDACWNDAQYQFSNGTVVETSVENGVSAATVKKMRARYLLIDTATLLKDHTL